MKAGTYLALLGGVSLVAIAASAPAAAQQAGAGTSAQAGKAKDGIEEVVVTARKKAERLQSVPVSVTALSGTQLREKAITQSTDLQYSTPSLTIQTASFGNQINYSIRGQGNGFNGNPGVITYFAGAPSDDGASVFYDLSSVQVLKGPQGTLFGQTSTGGAVLFEPQKPTNEFGGYVQGSVGNYGFQKVETAINIPIIRDKLLLRFAGYEEQRDGYTKSLTTGQDLDNLNRAGFRASLRFKPIDEFVSDTIVQMSNIDENGAGNVVIAANPANSGYALLGYGPVAGAGYFASTVCAGAAAQLGLTGATAGAFQAGCGAQRYSLLAQSLGDLVSEQRRAAAGIDGGYRANTSSFADMYSDRIWTINNTSNYHIGDYGFLTNAGIKNIFSYTWLGNPNSGAESIDGVAALNGDSQVPSGKIQPGKCITSGPNIGQCTTIQPPLVTPTQPRVLTEEVNLSGKLFNTLDLVGGYFYLQKTQGLSQQADFNVYNNVYSPELQPIYAYFGQQNSQHFEKGAFIQGNLDLSRWLLQGLVLTAGYRRTTISNSVNQYTSYLGSVQNVAYQGQGHNRTIGISWQINPRTLVYFRSGTGFKPGGNNADCVGSGAPGCLLVFGPETDEDYEVGIKADYKLGAANLRTDLALYRTDYNNILKNEILTTAAGGSVGVNLNLGQAIIQGVELSQDLVWGHAGFNIGYSYTEPFYTSYFEASGPQYPCTAANNANHDCLNEVNTPFTNTPKNKFSLSGRYTIPLGDGIGTLVPSFQYSYQTSSYYGYAITDSPHTMTNGYFLMNARLDWKNVMGLPIDCDLFAKNIFNRAYVTYEIPEFNQLGYVTGNYGEPAVYGFELRYRFGADAH